MKIEHLKTRLEYNPETGMFTWKDGKRVGKVAGCRFADGYINIFWKGKMIGAHRMAWFYTHGIFPRQIDHINGNPSDNRISNLRPSTQAQNKQNSRVKRTAKHGLKGICYCKLHKKWRSMIGPRGAVKHLGYFATKEEAHAAYAMAAAEMYGRFARLT